MRFFAAGARSGSLTVQALYAKRDGQRTSVQLGTVRSSGAWAPGDVLPMRVDKLAQNYDDAMSVSLRFTPRGTGTWQIDDVYVDPYRMR